MFNDPPPPRRREETLRFCEGSKRRNPSPNAAFVPRSGAAIALRIISRCADGGGGRFHGERTGSGAALFISQLLSGAIPGVPAVGEDLSANYVQNSPMPTRWSLERLGVFLSPRPRVYAHFYSSRYRKLRFHDM